MSDQGLIVDLFAGPGGWSEGLRAHGLADVGVEWDEAACATRAAAGHTTIRADVASYPLEQLAGRTWGMVASPPCTAFSTAGQGAGVEVIDRLVAAIRGCEWGALREHPATVWLPLEVGRWVDGLRPAWLACEQVPPALPLWEAYVPWLRSLGYSVWAGVLNAADYGVAQTRRRVFLLATRERVAGPPEPTHAQEPQADLFGGCRERWVSMAEALGWGTTADVALSERQANGATRAMDEPAMTITGSADNGNYRWIELDRRNNGAPVLDPTRVPCLTVTGAPFGKGVWVVRTGTNTMRHNRDSADVEGYERDVTEPAPTVDTKAVGAWTVTRPATTVCADPRISPPGWRGRPEDYTADGAYLGVRSTDGAIKITEADALVLQSFRPDYPLRGSRSQRFEQVGNAVPPLLAAAIIGALVG